MRVCHTVSAGFDDPNLVSCAGLVPVMALSERAGLHDLARAHVRAARSAGSNAEVKVGALVAGMVADADSIEAMDLLRHGAMSRVFTPGRTPPRDHPPTRPDHPAPTGATKDPKWKTRTDWQPTHAPA